MPISTSSHSATIAASIAMYPSRPCSALRPAAVLPPTRQSSGRARCPPTEQPSRHQSLDHLGQKGGVPSNQPIPCPSFFATLDAVQCQKDVCPYRRYATER